LVLSVITGSTTATSAVWQGTVVQVTESCWSKINRW